MRKGLILAVALITMLLFCMTSVFGFAVSKLVTLDGDSNGYIDTLEVTFDSAVNDSTINTSSIECFMVENILAPASAVPTNWDTGTANDIVVYLNLTAQLYTNLTPNYNYTANATCNVSGASYGAAAQPNLTSIANTLSLDGAPPAFLTCNSYDDDTDGRLNYVTCEMSENVTASDGLTTGLFSMFVNYGSDATTTRDLNRQLTPATVVTYGEGNKTQATVNISFADSVYGTGNVSLAYTGASTGVTDLYSNYTSSNASVTVTDSAAPVIVFKSTYDWDSDGYLDAFYVNFSEPISNLIYGTSENTFNASHNFTIGFTGTGDDSCNAGESLCMNSSEITLDPQAPFGTVGGANDSVLYLNFSDTERNMTTGQSSNLTMSLNATFLIEDLVGNDAVDNATNENATDKAAPAFLVKDLLDDNKDGYVDTVNMTFSEPIDDSTCDAANFTIQGISSLTLNTNFAGNNTADDEYVFLTISEALYFTNGTATVNYTTSADSATENCTDLYGNLLVQNKSAVLTVDKMSPVFLSAVFSDGASAGENVDTDDYLLITFSEPLNFTGGTGDTGAVAMGSTGIFNDTVHSGESPGTLVNGLFYLDNPAYLLDIAPAQFNNSQNLTLNMTFNNTNTDLSLTNTLLLFMNASWGDVLGNMVPADNNTNISITGGLYNAPSAQEGTGSQSSGGGGAISQSYTASPTTTKAVSTQLKPKDSVSFTSSGGSSHKVTLNAIYFHSERVHVTVNSLTYEVILNKGEPVELDTDGNGKKDIRLTLKSLTWKSADIETLLLSETAVATPVVAPVTTTPVVEEDEPLVTVEELDAEPEAEPATTTTTDSEVTKSSTGKIVSLVVILVLIAVFAVVLLLGKKKK